MRDPYRLQPIVSIGNRVVVEWLGGWGAALSAEKLNRHDILSIWDDRVLNRAFHVKGGVPRVRLMDADGTIPPGILEALRNYLKPIR